MFEYGTSIFHNHSSENEPIDPNISNNGNGGGGGGVSGWPCPHCRPQPGATRKHHHHNHHHEHASPQKRPRGRPPGSKNRPKPQLVITQENNEGFKPVVIEIATGLDVVKALVNYSRRHHVGISVLCASGSIANVTLHHPLPHSSSFTIHGPFTMLALTGTYISASPSFALNPNHPFSTDTNSFGISLLGSQGEVFGGVIDGKVVAGSNVTVMAMVFKKPEFHKFGFNGNGNVNVNDEGGVIAEKEHNPNASGGDHNNIMSELLNQQVPSDDDVMQWGRIYSSTF
ncbi:hypothetical protein Lal_00011223 [Lupinus albus]|uniref:Putative PPC domain-containing protein n=1 Tax=Lupinus albus TaxID=3870 RepID=A0A6A4PH19_LUPAL|nr:putative PPC domain-containing protein [Lupinus albus]KAF1888452.1 hypothetical protein Lal_00011223 [Lupinus albus]